MGIKDLPPAHIPQWLPLAGTFILALGAWCYYAVYILMYLRSQRTKSYGMPLVATALNWSWEVIYAFYVAEHPLELVGIGAWFFLDIAVVYTTIKYAPNDWELSGRWVGRNMKWVLVGMTVVGIWGNWAFAEWFLAIPGRGACGSPEGKVGRQLRGLDRMDSSEMAFWSALVPQAFISVGSLAMLVSRGHSGGVSYAIWAFRFVGSIAGLAGLSTFNWWFWPEANCYITTPLAIFMCGLYIIPDLICPFVLWWVRRTEVELPDGRLVGAEQARLLVALGALEGRDGKGVAGVNGEKKKTK